MFKFTKNTYYLNIADMDAAIDFYQKALGLHMIDMNESQTLISMSDDSEEFILILRQGEKSDGLKLSVQAPIIADAYELHSDMNCIVERYPKEGKYLISDGQGNTIEINAEYEKINFNVRSKEKSASEDEEIPEDDIE